jgi:hypothetical protein
MGSQNPQLMQNYLRTPRIKRGKIHNLFGYGAPSDLVTYVEIPSTLYPKFPLALSTAALCHSAW